MFKTFTTPAAKPMVANLTTENYGNIWVMKAK